VAVATIVLHIHRQQHGENPEECYINMVVEVVSLTGNTHRLTDMNKDKPEYSDDVQRAINSELDEIIEMIKRRKGRVE
jgi:hypothetical protein